MRNRTGLRSVLLDLVLLGRSLRLHGGLRLAVRRVQPFSGILRRRAQTLHEVREKMPFNLAMGISKEFANAPIRISVSLQDLTHWKSSYYGSSDGNEISGGKRFWNHVSLGAEVFPTAQTWIGLGYNFRRGNEMKVADSSHWAGFSIGGGIGIKKFKVGVSYAKYHISSSSLIVNAAYSL